MIQGQADFRWFVEYVKRVGLHGFRVEVTHDGYDQLRFNNAGVAWKQSDGKWVATSARTAQIICQRIRSVFRALDLPFLLGNDVFKVTNEDGSWFDIKNGSELDWHIQGFYYYFDKMPESFRNKKVPQ